MINWSEISNRRLMGRLLRLLLKLVPGSTIVRIKQGPCRGMKWIVGSSTHGCWLGSYELYKQKVIEKFIKPGMVIYDVGAQAGIYTLLFSKLVGPYGKVFAFEPLAENTFNISRHICLNGLQNVTLIQAALAERSGLVNFEVGKNNSTGSITLTPTHLHIATYRIDDLIESYRFPKPGSIKSHFND